MNLSAYTKAPSHSETETVSPITTKHIMSKPSLHFDNKTSKQQTFLYFYAYLTLGAVISSLGPTLHYLSGNTHVGFDLIGLTFSARSFGYLIGSFVLGRLYDRIPGHKILLGLFAVSVLIIITIPLVPSISILLMMMFFIGTAMGGVDVGSNTLVVWVHGHRSSPFLTAMFFFAGIGSILAPLIVSFFDQTPNGNLYAYLLLGAMLVPGLIAASKIPSPPIKVRSENKTAAPLPVFPFTVFAMLFMFYVGAEVSFGGWIHTFVTNSHLGNAHTASLVNSVFWIAITLGRLLMVPIAAKVSPKKLIIGCLSSAVVSMGIILAFPNSLTAIWVMTLGVGFSIASIFPITFSITEQMIPLTGARNGILWAAGSAGGIIFPWLIGKEIQQAGSTAFPRILLFAWAAALLLFGSILFYQAMNRKREETN